MKSIAIVSSIVCCALVMLAWSRPAHAGQAVATCYAIDVATYSDRVHIHCAPPVTACSLTPGACAQEAQNEPPYFAVETTSPMAAAVVQSGISSLNSKRALEISYDDNPDDNPAGCLQQDCRRIVGVVIR